MRRRRFQLTETCFGGRSQLLDLFPSSFEHSIKKFASLFSIPAEKGSESYGITFVFARIQQQNSPNAGVWVGVSPNLGKAGIILTFLLRIQARSYLLSFAGRKLLPTPRTPHPLTINPHHFIRRDRITAGSTGGIQLREDFFQTGFGNAGHILTASTESSAPTNPSLSASPA